MDSLVFGLGNPGPRYADNRHNIGQHVVRFLARELSCPLSPHKGGAEAGGVRLADANRIILAYSQGYMNTSGGPVSYLAKYYKIAPANTLVIHDDLDIPFGQIKVKNGGGDGGHNGLKDITKALGTPNYTRIRIGIGRPPGAMPVKNYVLQNFSKTEQQGLDAVIAAGAQACEMLLTKDLLTTQQSFHGKDVIA